ncbi:sensor histidine kinase [Bacillus taeanensis]|uniref:histidine kinase n=1 Tax=Bacillus taeanensis TaxID=273032 RepID=A0A366Y0Y5_9BACI|nr:sensor histidine kinase [Bacillus taeanensis]RBW71506.1 sensor histidine kinase [Bacillus taeanensis]
MWDLLFSMFERLAIIVTVAFIMTRFRFFRSMVAGSEITRLQKTRVIIMFGCFGIIGTYTGLTLNTETLTYTKWMFSLEHSEAIANSRVIGIVVAGLLGGWKVGLGAGIIAGFHRYLLGGFTAFSCGISAIAAGLLSGFFHHKLQNRLTVLSTSFIVGALAEALQMLIILFTAQPFQQAVFLVEKIGMPMIIANGIGAALFILIIRNVISEEEKMGALQAQKALRLAELTSKHLRRGLNEKTASATCDILLKEVQAIAVSITNETHILAHKGRASDHHHKNIEIQTSATKEVLMTGQLLIASSDKIQCVEKNCPLKAAIIAPLKQKDNVVGTLKFYFHSHKDITHVVIELIKGLSSLLSQQLELAEADRHRALAQQAEIKALQAQVSPHFLFNALNTIVSLIRTDPLKARKLLISLSQYFRQNLSGTTKMWISLEEELRHVKAYLAIEQARFSDKLNVYYHIDQEALASQLPPLTLQPLVENAVKHGLKGMKQGSSIIITVKNNDEHVLVKVEDNGVGIPALRLNKLLNEQLSSTTGTGIGLYNVNRRLIMMLGEKGRLIIKSEQGKGASISFKI